ncbi:MAG: DEAD/DEAH box helicase [Planctomycetes bacterium]|nr:DEAD/DEAH box helicase [Planctomycetota bacterium]
MRRSVSPPPPPPLRAGREEGYEHPTPIQKQTIRPVLEGRDVLGCAQTGTGKTAAFALPILQRLHGSPAPSPRHVRVLVLSPTRELATQIGDSFARYGRHTGARHVTIFGGVGQNPQAQALRHGVDILVATPGRLLDLMQQRIARLDRVEILVLDEADRMLDMGFIHDVRRVIAALPKKRQTLLFSATLPLDIQSLAHDLLHHPVRVEVTPPTATVDKIAQSLYHVDRQGKFALLCHLLKDPALRRMLVFTRTKRGANKLAVQLNRSAVKADAIHGNKAQGARERALEDFRNGHCRVLVATDIASRGIDVEEITHVVNYDLPDVPENYVHRIGRTARAGAEGNAIAFCSAEERGELMGVERFIGMRIPHRPIPAGVAAPALAPPAHPARNSGAPSRAHYGRPVPHTPHPDAAPSSGGHAHPRHAPAHPPGHGTGHPPSHAPSHTPGRSAAPSPSNRFGRHRRRGRR